MLIVKDSKNKGRGIFAARSIAVNKLVIIDHCIIISKNEYDILPDDHKLLQYAFWCDDPSIYFFGLGLSSLVNHSKKPNCDYAYDYEANKLEFMSIKDIKAGEELTINYGWEKYPWKNI